LSSLFTAYYILSKITEIDKIIWKKIDDNTLKVIFGIQLIEILNHLSNIII